MATGLMRNRTAVAACEKKDKNEPTEKSGQSELPIPLETRGVEDRSTLNGDA